MPRMTGSSITMDEARDYELSLPSTDNGERPTSTTNEADDENRVLTLAELKELIESGDMDKIPNNKIIPEKLNVSYSFYFLVSSNFTFTIGCDSKSIDGSYKKETLGGGNIFPMIFFLPLTILVVYMYD